MISLDQLRKRKIFQWAIAYLAGAWLLLQILDLLAQPFAWPDLVLRTMTVLLGIGFFAVLVLAWYHGEQGRQKAGGIELLMLAGILLVAGLAVRMVIDDPIEAAATTDTAGDVAATQVAEQGSIAVLPFVNMSSDEEQEYFSDGLTEELLNVLAQIPELRVAARTSAFSFKGTNVAADSVGRALNVANILEGSVRKSGERVRITAQLIDARTGFHLWSDTYDRELKDVFAVQDEISRAIVEQLRLKLTHSGQLVRQETADPEAHALVLKGIAAYRIGTSASIANSVELFQQAIARDPKYARAHALLANSMMILAYFRSIPLEMGYDSAVAAANRASSLDASLADPYVLRARLLDSRDWKFEEAEDEYRLALQKNPGDGRALSLHAWLLMRLGRTEEALAAARRAVAIDALSPSAYNNLGVMYAFAGQYEEAVQASLAALALSPENMSTMGNLALTYTDLERHADAVRTVDKLRAIEPDEGFTLATAAYVYGRAGRSEQAQEALEALLDQGDSSPYLVATAYAGLRDRENAFKYLEIAVRRHDDQVPDVGMDPAFHELRDDPRMNKLLKAIGLPTKP